MTTTTARIDMAKARMGEILMPKITQMAVGTGGHDPLDITKPIPPTPDQIALEQEILRKPVTATRMDNSIHYVMELGKDEANGYVITEQALIDEKGAVVAVKTFAGKAKDQDTTLALDWYEYF
ncbi:phage tail-collar fiber domain-containing protein [Paradesulfitobacterium aromaticivorans]